MVNEIDPINSFFVVSASGKMSIIANTLQTKKPKENGRSQRAEIEIVEIKTEKNYALNQCQNLKR